MDNIDCLQSEYLKVFEQIKPYLDDMRDNWHLYPYYRGWADIDSPIIFKPDILFIGINRGDGRFRSWNWNKKKINYSLPPDYPTPWRSHLHYTEKGTARNNEWWDNSPLRNMFPYTICELLVRVYRNFNEYAFSYPRKELTSVFESKVMATNVYTMVTSEASELRHLMKDYHKNTGINIKQLCKKRLKELIKLTQPKVVVLLGKTVEKDIVYIMNDLQQPYICISRQRGWHGKENICKAADKIYSIICND